AAAAVHCRALLDAYPQCACRDGAYAIACAAAQAANQHAEALALARRWKEECPASAARATVEEAQALDASGEAGAAEKLLSPYLAPRAQGAPEAAERPRALQLLGLACWHQAEPLFAKADAAAVRLRDFLGGKKLRELDETKRERAAVLRREWLDALSAAREAENRMVAALSLAVDDYPELPGRAANLLRLGEAAYDRGQLDSAMGRYRQALAADAAGVADKARYRLGWCALRQSEKAAGAEKKRLRQEAEREFAGVARDFPQSPLAGESAWQAAELRRAARDFAGARPLYEQAREHGRTAEIRDGAACAAAACLLELRQYREAYDAFKAFAAAAHAGPAKAWLPEANWGAGFAALKLGAYDEAREYFLAAKAGNYNGEAAAKARYGLGMIEFEQGHWKSAREEFRKVELFHAAWPEVAALARVKAAAASQELGEAESAARDLQRVIDKYAGAAAVAQARELLAKMPAGR
ncbi:MAG: hypothetical protein J6333_12805, partial [Planctomycetes bacterium]|nr:hypothetical protein [Planctomycetota bacterium]